MHTFLEHIQYLRLFNRLQFLETFYPIDSKAYDALFEVELDVLIARIMDPIQRKELEGVKGFGWTNYIAKSVRNSGVSDARELDERTHEIASKLLLGGLFSNFDPTKHGPLGRRFMTSVRNAIQNQVQKEKNRRRYLSSVPIHQEIGDTSTGSNKDNENLIEEFRQLVLNRLGHLELAVLDLRLAGDETKSLVGSEEFGEPTSYRVKQAVIAIKQLAQEFARQQGDDGFWQQIQRAMDAERETLEKRFGTKP
jgi:hypothetical protein